MQLMHEKIDDLRELLGLPDRNVVSAVTLKGLVDTTTDASSIRTFEDSGDVAFVFVGPEDKLKGVIRENKDDGTVTYEFTMPSGWPSPSGAKRG